MMAAQSPMKNVPLTFRVGLPACYAAPRRPREWPQFIRRGETVGRGEPKKPAGHPGKNFSRPDGLKQALDGLRSVTAYSSPVVAPRAASKVPENAIFTKPRAETSASLGLG